MSDDLIDGHSSHDDDPTPCAKCGEPAEYVCAHCEHWFCWECIDTDSQLCHGCAVMQEEAADRRMEDLRAEA